MMQYDKQVKKNLIQYNSLNNNFKIFFFVTFLIFALMQYFQHF